MLCIVELSVRQTAFAVTFNDVSNYHEEINFLTEKDVIRGFPDGSFRPSLSITRLQAVRMIMRDLGIPKDVTPPNPEFVDLKPTEDGYLEVARAVQLGIVSGTDYHVFNPHGNLTRAQMTKILTNAYEFSGTFNKTFTDVPSNSWAVPYINSMASLNVTIGYPDGSFKPNLPISRAHFAVFMARILNPAFKPKSTQISEQNLKVIEDIQVIDAIKHPDKPIMYVINGKDNTLLSINYETYETDFTDLAFPAEKLAYANGHVFVTQVKHPHNSYTFDESQDGAFAIYDGMTLDFINLHHIQLDPYDMEVDNRGTVYISGGSGQWTRMVSFNGLTGEELSSQSIREKSDIQFNKDQTIIYTINTDISPHFTTYEVRDNMLQTGINFNSLVDEYYKVTHMDVSANGNYLFTSNGLVFPTNNNEYMSSSESLYYPFKSSAYALMTNEMFFSNGNRLIQVYNSNTIEKTYQLAAFGSIQHMFYDDQKNMLLLLSLVKGDQSQFNLGIEKILLK